MEENNLDNLNLGPTTNLQIVRTIFSRTRFQKKRRGKNKSNYLLDN